jgi:hypothetical protein
MFQNSIKSSEQCATWTKDLAGPRALYPRSTRGNPPDLLEQLRMGLPRRAIKGLEGVGRDSVAAGEYGDKVYRQAPQETGRRFLPVNDEMKQGDV